MDPLAGALTHNRAMDVRLRILALLLGARICLSYQGASAQAGIIQERSATSELSVSGDIPSKFVFQTKDLDAMPQVSALVIQENGSKSKFTGVLLRSLLEKAGAPIGRALRGKAMASYVLAKARDGYEVMFTLPELDPSFGNERVLVVYKQDGKPLFGYEGPFKILCPDDKAGARSIRMLTSLEIVRLRK